MQGQTIKKNFQNNSFFKKMAKAQYIKKTAKRLDVTLQFLA